jgi:hypothetical protein
VDAAGSEGGIVSLFPPPDATRAEIDAWYRKHDPTMDDPCYTCGHERRGHGVDAGDPGCDCHDCKCDGFEAIEHEAPKVLNGPSLVCNACGKVRVCLNTPFCKRCSATIEGVL